MGNRYRSLNKIIWIICFLLALPLVAQSQGTSGKIVVTWDAIDDPELAGYTVVWGLTSKSYGYSQNTGLVTEATLQLEAGKTYYLAVRGYDKQGLPGELSSEVSALAKASDETPPVVSNLSVGNVTSNSATVTWNTNEESYVQVEYGKTPSLGSYSGLTNVSAISHAVNLKNLSGGTTYYYRVMAKDLSGNQVLSEILSFRTKDGNGDTNDPDAPFKFIQITLSNVSNTSVTINWTTNKITYGFIQYGLDASLTSSAAESTQATSHSATLGGLVPSTQYRYKITAADSTGTQLSSGLLLFKTSDRISQPARPSSDAIFIPSVFEGARFRTNLGINNLSKSVANVSVTLVDKEGIVLATKTVQVEPEGLKQINSVAHFLYDNNQGNEIEGNLYLESDQQVSAWASQIDNTTNDPSLLVSKRNGSTQLLIPSTANISKFTSSLVIMNVGFTDAQVAIKVFSTSGSVLGKTLTPLSISPNGILTFENVLQILGVIDNYGPLEITSLNNVPLIASSRVSSANKAGGFFEGLRYSDASTLQIIPHVVDTAEIRTNIGINNVTGVSASVMVKLMSRGGTQLAALPVTVPARGLTQINNVIRQLLKQNVGSNTEGYIRLESNQPIFGWASEIDNKTNDPGFSISKSHGSNKLLVQSTANIGNFKSSLIVVNTGTADALVDIVARDAEGNIDGETRGVLIPVGGFFSSSNILDELGVNSNYGPVEITSTNGQPLLVSSRVYSSSGTSGFFEGQVME